VDGVSFQISRGETLSLVGESGCGKSTVGRAILRLFDVTGGQVILDGQRIDDLSAGSLRPVRRRMQVVFQDPFSSLNPRSGQGHRRRADPQFWPRVIVGRSRCAGRRADGQGPPAARCGAALAA